MKLNKKVVDLINEGFKAKTLKGLTDPQLNKLHEKVCKKKEPKEAVTKTSTTTTYDLNNPVDTDSANAALAKNGADADIKNKKINVTNINGTNPVEVGEQLKPGHHRERDYDSIMNKMRRKYGWGDFPSAYYEAFKNSEHHNPDSDEDNFVKDFHNYMFKIQSGEIDDLDPNIYESKNNKNNPWAICTSSVGRKDKKKFEACVRDIKKKNKGKIEENLFLEQKILNLVQKYIQPKMSKKEFMSMVEGAEPTTKPKEPTTKPGTKTPPKEKPFDPFKPDPHKNPKPKARKSETKEQVQPKKRSIPNWLNFKNLGVKFK